MTRHAKSWVGIAVLGFAAAVWAALPSQVLAHGGGGGHGGGGHGGFGGGHYGGHYGGYGGHHYGGYGYGRYGYGGYGYGGLGLFGLGGWGLGYPYYGAGLSLYQNGYGYGYPGYYGYGSGYGYSGYPGSYGGSYGGYYSPGYLGNSYAAPQSLDPLQSPANRPVHLTVRVPAGAEIYLEDAPTTQKGTVREFVSPPLEPGNYTYDIRATWTESGRRHEETRHLTVHPGDDVNVTFPNTPPKTAPAQP